MRNKANTLLIKENMTIREKNREIRYTGTFDSNARGFGFVKVEGFERDLFIPEGRDGGAVYGDTVEVRILKGSVDENGRSDDGRGRRAEAEVTAIIERGIRQIVGTYHPFRKPVRRNYSANPAAGKGRRERKESIMIAGVVTPDQPKIPFEVDIPEDGCANALQGHKVVADITRYNVSGENPVGRISEILGHITDPGVDILSLVKSFGIPSEFPQEVLDEAEKVLEGGYLGDSFPLYASSYSYADRAYSDSELNTVEALCTFLNLARAGRLPDASLAWLKKNTAAGTLYARYTTDGTAVSGYTYFATSVYGLAALIAEEVGDSELREQAVRKMERYQRLDAEDDWFGGFCAEGVDTSAFDQLIPLLVYEEGNF